MARLNTTLDVVLPPASTSANFLGNVGEGAGGVELPSGVVLHVGPALLKAFDPGRVKQQFQILLLPVQFCLSTINLKRMT